MFSALFLLYFDIFFYIEKIYGDSAYYLFQIINFKRFAIEHARPASIFIEIIPLLLAKKGIAMDQILFWFSIGIWIYYFVCGLILAIVLKMPKMTLALYLTLIIGAKINYYNPVSELILSAPLLIIAFCIYKKSILKISDVILLTLLYGFIIWNHPLYSLVVPILLGCHLLVTQKAERNRIILLGLILCAIVVRFYSLDEYERNSMSDSGNDAETGLAFLRQFNYARFFSKIAIIYAGVIILCILTFITIRKKKRAALASGLFLAGLSCYVFIVLYKYGRLFAENSEPFERYFFPVPLLICMVYFAYGYVNNKLNNIMMMLLFLYHAIQFCNYSLLVNQRFDLLEKAARYAKESDANILTFRKENYFPKIIGHDWIMSSESLLLTSIEGPGSSRQFFIEEFYSSDDLNRIDGNKFIHFPSPLWQDGSQDLNNQYFKFRDNPHLLYANTDGLQSAEPDSFFKNIHFEYDGEMSLKAKRKLFVPIIITNFNSKSLSSGTKKEQVFISYHWIKDGKIVVWDGLRTPILGDVNKRLEQMINVETPDEKGQYILELSLVYEGKKWAPVVINKRNKVRIS
jgi:hypothetical protein